MDIFIKYVGILLTYFFVQNATPIHYAGSGFIVNYHDSYYIITCRHCIDNFNEPGFGLKLNGKSKNDNSIKNVTILVKKTDFIYNPNDTDSTSFDIAIYPFKHLERFFSNCEIESLKLPDYDKLPQIEFGDSITVVGFPQKYANKNALDNDSISLLPFFIKAEYLNTLPKSNLFIDGNTKKLQEQHFAKIDRGEDFKGASGGLVLLVKDKSYYPIGIFSSQGNGIFNGKETNFIGFAHIKRIYEIINALYPASQQPR